MPVFICLTDEDDCAVYVNVNSIEMFYRHGDFTSIVVGPIEYIIKVRENPKIVHLKIL